ncbi:MAG: D-alanyl-D-alanine carboxypeptidase [Desulfomonile tiedjei]|nr:D-alanyl-D-alanine carboxypeptidase [Desulfomonile tiedjei]
MSSLIRSRSSIVLGIFFLLIFSWAMLPAFAEARSAQAAHHKLTKKKILKKKAEKKKSKPASRGVEAKAGYCVDLAGNQTLWARNADQQVPIASLTKLVTALVALEHMPMSQKLTVPEHIKKIPKSVVGLKPGDTVSVGDLLHGLLIGSGNDCAETLACGLPGGSGAFIKAMNKKVRSLGTKQTIFYTASGLDKKADNGKDLKESKDAKDSEDVESNLSTAREIARIAQVAFAHPTVREICLKRSHVLASSMEKSGYSVRTTNKLLRDNLPLIGGKTGYTSKAGHCLATEFVPGRNVFLIVVLGSPDHFRDTRLVYRKALKEATRVRIPPVVTKNPKQIAANQK